MHHQNASQLHPLCILLDEHSRHNTNGITRLARATMAESEQTTGGSTMKRKASLPANEGSKPKQTRANPEATTPAPEAKIVGRPAPAGQPEVWAQDRQALCETLPTFRSYQGALYHTGGQVKGVLLSGDTGLSHLSPEVVIFRAPGKAGVDKDGWKRQLESHSWKDASVKALAYTRDTKGIVFFHVSSANTDLAIELPHPICSIGAYWLTDVWSARLDGKLSIWCKAQKLRLDQSRWWVPLGVPIPSSQDHSVSPKERSCTKCTVVSPQRYSQMWMCLNSSCEKFFRNRHGELAELAGLEYSQYFLLQRKPFPSNAPSGPDLIPSLPDVAKATDSMWWMRDEATRGMVCRGCGQCLPRKWFRGWKCDHCNFKFFPEMTSITISQLLGPQHELTTGTATTSLEVNVTSVGEWRVHTYTLDDENTITHFQANSVINSAPGGSDELFLALQGDEKLELRRFALHNRAQREFLAAHYSQNFGMPYKYVVATESKPFSEAPKPILAVKDRLAWATQQIVGAEHDAYNELLAVGYFAGNKMGFHDDGEKDLGPNVTSLSLGSDSTMSFRVKRKYHQGYTGQSFDGRNLLRGQDPIMPCSFLASERAALVAQGLNTEAYLEALDNMYTAHWNGLVATHGEKKALRLIQNATSPKLLIELNLHHGDMVLMSGHRIQKYLEHAVSGIGGLRFALTCREITPPKDMEDPDSYIDVPIEQRSRFDGLVHHPLSN